MYTLHIGVKYRNVTEVLVRSGPFMPLTHTNVVWIACRPSCGVESTATSRIESSHRLRCEHRHPGVNRQRCGNNLSGVLFTTLNQQMSGSYRLSTLRVTLRLSNLDQSDPNIVVKSRKVVLTPQRERQCNRTLTRNRILPHHIATLITVSRRCTTTIQRRHCNRHSSDLRFSSLRRLRITFELFSFNHQDHHRRIR